VDRKGGNQTADIEKISEAKHAVSLNPPRIRLFPSEFFNNIGRQRPDYGPDRRHSAKIAGTRRLGSLVDLMLTITTGG
jgi:hypothetical protein